MRLLAVVVFSVLVFDSVSSASGQSGKFTLVIPPKFSNDIRTHQFKRGEDTLKAKGPFIKLRTIAPMNEYSGCWGPCAISITNHAWRVRVYEVPSPKVVAAHRSARDGYDADLCEERDFLGVDECSYMFARFARKQFHWGDAVTLLSCFSQDAMYAPNNGHLQYEIWGTTRDGKHTVVAWFAVTHPKLTEWGPRVRIANSLTELKNDPDYKRIEKCSPEEFTPTLTDIDKFIDSLALK